MLKATLLIFLVACGAVYTAKAQEPAQQVNVYLGSSGDHGQLTPAASSPFSQLSILPQTYPTLHSGYEYLAKSILGFTHNRIEGVGCTGSGGLILLKPFLGKEDDKKPLTKIRDHASPGNYSIQLKEGIDVKISVDDNFGTYLFNLPQGDKGISLDFGHAFSRGFVAESHDIKGNQVSGWVKAKTTCGVGVYTIYYALEFAGILSADQNGKHKVIIHLKPGDLTNRINIAFSSVSTDYAVARIQERQKGMALIEAASTQQWNNVLGRIKVKGDPAREKLFYSLLYRTLQSPYKINEKDGSYRATNGALYQSSTDRYHGWAVWDNYKTQLPLLALLFPDRYQDMISSISDLYRYGKYNFAGPNEPANSVRTEHSAVVLLDAINKGFKVDVKALQDSLIADTLRFDFTKPDKYLESCYDMWATGKLLEKNKQQELSKKVLNRSTSFAWIWNKEFKDLAKNDVDKMSGRNMYQGTIRQYRWSVPFDVKELMEVAGGRAEFTRQLDDFFDNNYFNRANEPDMQSQTLYYATDKHWKYQEIVHKLAVDTVIQFYFNDNSRGIDAHIDRIYKNEPKAFIRTMDDDAGAMSAWFILTAIGMQQPLIGEPVYYLNVPLFPAIELNNGKATLAIKVRNFGDDNKYISGVLLNGKRLDRLWVTHQEIAKGGILEIEASSSPSAFGGKTMWVAGAQ